MDGSARQYAGALPMIALGVATLISAWAVFAVVVVVTPWAVRVLLPWAHRLRAERPRWFGAAALLGGVLVAAGIATAFATHLGPAAALTAGVALLCYAVLVGGPLLRGSA